VLSKLGLSLESGYVLFGIDVSLEGNGEEPYVNLRLNARRIEGACVRHRVTHLGAGEKRVVLSMTFCTDPRATPLQSAGRRFKDIAYYGPRALWT